MPRVIQKSSLVLVWRTSNVLKSSGQPSRLEPMARLMRLLDKCSSVLVRTISYVLKHSYRQLQLDTTVTLMAARNMPCPGG